MKEAFSAYEAIIALHDAQLAASRVRLLAEQAERAVSVAKLNLCALAAKHLIRQP